MTDNNYLKVSSNAIERYSFQINKLITQTLKKQGKDKVPELIALYIAIASHAKHMHYRIEQDFLVDTQEAIEGFNSITEEAVAQILLNFTQDH